MNREEKYNFYYQQNKDKNVKNALGEIMKPRLCDSCDRILGVDVFRMIYTEEKQNKCEYCTNIAKPYVMDYTEKALREGMPAGKFRDKCIERHRMEAKENVRKMGNVVKNNKKLTSEL